MEYNEAWYIEKEAQLHVILNDIFDELAEQKKNCSYYKYKKPEEWIRAKSADFPRISYGNLTDSDNNLLGLFLNGDHSFYKNKDGSFSGGIIFPKSDYSINGFDGHVKIDSDRILIAENFKHYKNLTIEQFDKVLGFASKILENVETMKPSKQRPHNIFKRVKISLSNRLSEKSNLIKELEAIVWRTKRTINKQVGGVENISDRYVEASSAIGLPITCIGDSVYIGKKGTGHMYKSQQNVKAYSYTAHGQSCMFINYGEDQEAFFRDNELSYMLKGDFVTHLEDITKDQLREAIREANKLFNDVGKITVKRTLSKKDSDAKAISPVLNEMKHAIKPDEPAISIDLNREYSAKELLEGTIKFNGLENNPRFKLNPKYSIDQIAKVLENSFTKDNVTDLEKKMAYAAKMVKQAFMVIGEGQKEILKMNGKSVNPPQVIGDKIL